MKIKNLIIYVSVIIIVFSSLKLPKFLMKNLSENLNKKVYKIEENKNQIDVEAEKIYLVKAIHSIKNDSPSVIISSNSKEIITEKGEDEYSIATSDSASFPDIDKQLKEICDYNIITNLNFDKYGLGIIDKTYLNKNQYIVHNVLVELDDTEIHVEIENKTGKIIYMYFDKSHFYGGNIEKILKNYVRYLDLHIIKDWNYEEDLINKKYSLTSESAKLSIVLDTSNDNYELSIRVSKF